MASIDNRIVEMKFDNAAFQTKIESTIKSIEKLDASLKLAQGTQGLKNVDTAASRVNFAPISSALDTITSKFNLLSVVGLATLVNITNKAVDAGVALGKSLSLEQVIVGFKEYETNMRSIQTIMANTRSEGATLDQVNNALDILNTYSDQTIYNFSQMTRNIGTFTAAGVKLDIAVGSIKGIANLAAVSGSSAEQAANAMYQLSQAISTGSLKLMDWNSVVNAGMGGRVFQEALFETGKTLGTIKNVPIDRTFEEWTKAGNTFRGSLEQGWITSDVLTQTLRNFTGELSKEQLLFIGYTEKQADQIVEMGGVAVEAATKVRTLTQLIDVAREAVASGWSQSFRTILGDFEQATELFSGISESFSKIIGDSASARNELLSDWASFGGRKAVINGITNSAKALGDVINAVKAGFKNIFPPITAVQLTRLSWAFEDFTKKLIPSKVTIITIRDIFKGIFSVFEIGITIVKEIANSFKTLFGAFAKSEGSSELLRFVKGLAKDLVRLNEVLVNGGLIAKIFDAITQSIIRFAKDPLGELERLKDIASEIFNVLLNGAQSVETLPEGVVLFLNKLRDAILNVIEKVPLLDILAQGFIHVRDRISELADSATPIIDGLKTMGNAIVDWFAELKTRMVEAAAPDDFSKIIDGVNVAIIAGIGGLLAYLAKGINLDFGGTLGAFKETLTQFTGVLEGMQSNLKAEALLKIAGAVAVLAISVLLIAGIDSFALTRSLTALGTGLAGLMGTLTVLSGVKGPKGIATIGLMSLALLGLTTSLLILSIAIKVLSSLKPEELIVGITAVASLLGVLGLAAKLLSKHAVGMTATGIGLIAVAIALNILAGAVALFANMSWEDLAKGLSAATLGLIGIGVALRLMPWDTLTKGAGLVLVATSLAILAKAVSMFAEMSIEELAKGLGAVGLGLALIAAAMHLMPLSLPLTAAGLLLVSVSLAIIGKALQGIATLSWEDLAKGLVAIAGSMLLLVVAAHAMTGAVAGAIAMGIMSIALSKMADVLIKLSTLSWVEIVKGLIAIAAVFAVIGIAGTLIAPAIGPILGLASALLIAGIGMAAFGIGVNLLARGITILFKLIGGSIDWFVKLLDTLLTRIPAIVVVLAKALVEFLMVVLDALPPVIKQLGVAIKYLLEELVKLVPELGKLIAKIIDEIVKLIIDKSPDLVAAGFALLMSLLNGISENIGEIADVVIDIILKFISTLTKRLDEIVAAGLNLLVEFLKGITDNLSKVIGAVGELIAEVIRSIGTFVVDIMNAGVDVLVQFLKGITDNLVKVIDAVTQLITTFITEIGNFTGKLVEAGAKALVDFITGITQNLTDIGTAVTELITTLIDELGKNSMKIVDAGGDLIMDLLDGLASKSLEIVDAAFNAIVTFLNGIAIAIRENSKRIRDAGVEIAKALINGMTFGLAFREGVLEKAIRERGTNLVDWMKDELEVESPSRKFIKIGENVVKGLALGISNTDSSDKSSIGLAKRVVDNFRSSLSSLSSSLNFTDEFNPTITPVLDLTNVKMGAKSISDLVNVSDGISSTLTFKQAQTIANTQVPTNDTVTTQTSNTEVTFEQNIYSPTQLSTADIYRQTRNQITLAKEELSIP